MLIYACDVATIFDRELIWMLGMHIEGSLVKSCAKSTFIFLGKSLIGSLRFSILKDLFRISQGMSGI